MSTQQPIFPCPDAPANRTPLWLQFADCLCAIFFVFWILVPKTSILSSPLFCAGIAWIILRSCLIAPGAERQS